MMEYYSKIDTLFRRKDDFSVDIAEYTRPEFRLINQWSVTEKVDGTSVVIMYYDKGRAWHYAGRTDKSNFTDPMRETMVAAAEWGQHGAEILCERHGLEELTVYGELYGPKIQNGGAYSDELQFRAFDVKAGDNVFLSPNQFRDACAELDLETVPYMGEMSIADIIALCHKGFDSKFALRPKESEGIIAKSPVELRSNNGRRLMFKIKHRDFKAGKL